MNSTERPYTLFILALTLAMLSVLVAMRDISIGDTANYINYFNLLKYNSGSFKFEPIFQYLSVLLTIITDRPEVYLGSIFLLFNIAMINVYRVGFDFRQHIYLFALFGFLLISSWYIAATVNGLRQGLSLPFLYSAVLLISKKKYIKSAVFLIISINIHYASALAIPFIFLMMLRLRVVLYIFVSLSLLYILGVSEIIFKEISLFIDPSIYYKVIEYGLEADTAYGFSYLYVFYSFFWAIFCYYTRTFLRDKYINIYDNILKCYLVLMMPYFAFAHGGYSNRYAVIGWLFLPFLHTALFISLPISNFYKLALSIFLFIIGLLYYILSLNGFAVF